VPPAYDLAPAPFIVGVPRSGTTLLRLQLDAHPELALPAETGFGGVARRLEGSAVTRDELLDALTGMPTWVDLAMSRDELGDLLAGVEDGDLTAGLRAFYRGYAAARGKTRYGDKTPGHAADMEVLARVLPEAHFIHIIRDGRDVALSLSEVSWGPADITLAAEKWVSELRRARKRAHGLARGTYMELRYEDLVAEPEPVLRKVARFVDLPWDEAMLAYHRKAEERMSREMARTLKPLGGGTITAEERARQHELVSRPPSQSRVGRWRTEMSPEDRAAFELVAGKMLKRLGYEL
jgi:hypothetical protein